MEQIPPSKLLQLLKTDQAKLLERKKNSCKDWQGLLKAQLMFLFGEAHITKHKNKKCLLF